MRGEEGESGFETQILKHLSPKMLIFGVTRAVVCATDTWRTRSAKPCTLSGRERSTTIGTAVPRLASAEMLFAAVSLARPPGSPLFRLVRSNAMGRGRGEKDPPTQYGTTKRGLSGPSTPKGKCDLNHLWKKESGRGWSDSSWAGQQGGG